MFQILLPEPWASSREVSLLVLSKYRIPLVVALILLVHGSLLGLSDDEAYYWVLAQKPSLGYAYHPPMVAWWIGLFQSIFGNLFGNHSPGLVRLPAALGSSLTLALGLNWLNTVG